MSGAGVGRLGVVGVGEIAEAIVTGLLRPQSTAELAGIHLSPRSRDRAERLAQASPLVRVEADNQAVADAADVVLLSVLPGQAAEVLESMRLRPGTVLLSAVAGLDHATLQPLVGPDVTVVRAVPLPAVRHGAGTTAIYPDHPGVRALFDALGGTVAPGEEAAYSAVSAITSTMSTHVAIINELIAWGRAHGLEEETAERFVRGYYLGLDTSVVHSDLDGEELVGAHETPGGLNEQVRTTWLTPQAREGLRAALDAIYARVQPS